LLLRTTTLPGRPGTSTRSSIGPRAGPGRTSLSGSSASIHTMSTPPGTDTSTGSAAMSCRVTSTSKMLDTRTHRRAECAASSRSPGSSPYRRWNWPILACTAAASRGIIPVATARATSGSVTPSIACRPTTSHPRSPTSRAATAQPARTTRCRARGHNPATSSVASGSISHSTWEAWRTLISPPHS